MRINSNIMAMNTHRQYTINTDSVAKAMEKLSSGYRVNRAGDDAAGLAISEKMRAQIRGLQMASKNSSDAISLVQTAEGALQETHNILQRMREIAVQSASDTNETSIDRAALDAEFQQLASEVADTAKKTKFNDMGVIDGSYSGSVTTPGIQYDKTSGAGFLTPGSHMLDTGFYKLSAQVNADGAFELTMQYSKDDGATDAYREVSKLTLTDYQIGLLDYQTAEGDEVRLQMNDGTSIRFKLTPAAAPATDQPIDTAAKLLAAVTDGTGIDASGKVAAWEGKPITIQTGANEGDELRVNVAAMDDTVLGLDSLSVASGRAASHAVSRVNDAENFVSTQRATLGALQNRLTHKINNLDTSVENLAAAESRIRDLDMALEMTNFTKSNILTQASTAMLAQANAAPEGVLSLLQG